MASRAYKTLPSAFKRSDSEDSSRSKRSSSNNSRSSRGAASPLNTDGLFGGLHINLGLSNLISGGINLVNHLRRKTPTSGMPSSPMSPTPSSTSSVSSSSSGAAFYECQSHPRSSATSANVSEMIEMSRFHTVPLAEGEQPVQTGQGHNFVAVSSFNPTWCDLCRDLIWGLYDTGAMRCSNCNMTCHDKCRSKVQLNCTCLEQRRSSLASLSSSSDSSEEMSTLANISTIQDEENTDVEDNEGTLKDVVNMDLLINDSSEAPDGDSTTVEATDQDVQEMIGSDELESAVIMYNDGFPAGQETKVGRNGQCKGFVRVVMNLSRPINVLPGTQPPSVYNLTSESSSMSGQQQRNTLTSFYLPHETEKALCVNSATTTRDVIRSLLAKFRIVDNPHKYVLYAKHPLQSVHERRRSSTESTVTISGTVRSRATLGRIRLRRLGDNDRPLLMALQNCLHDPDNNKGYVFVLQENDPGEICWDSFSMPELKNFLLILDREEAWYKRKIHEKYEMIHEQMRKMAEMKREESSLAHGDY